MNYDEEYLKNYENLANAVVLQALIDYKKYGRYVEHPEQIPRGKNINLTVAKQQYLEAKAFFKSRWFGMLTSIDPDIILSKIDKISERQLASTMAYKKSPTKQDI